ncbi:MAG TPA: DUF5691 domain-containing protein [Candidatus Limnocylindrales bacterium]
MLSSPTPDQVRSLAPDPGAARAGEGLGARRHWSGTGRNDRAAWGLCHGSGSNPYQVTVDFGGPAFKCTCPSRKFPCKHGLGLLFLIAGDPSAVPVGGDPPSWAAEWLTTRSARTEAAETRARAVAEAPPEVVAAAAAEADAAREKRIRAREKKVDAGLVDLDRWLQDLVRRGLLAAKSEGYGFWDQAGARLVDAQAASLGRELRNLGAAVNRGTGWADGALERAARIHLIAEAYRRQETLPPGLRTDVRALVGWTIKEDDLPAGGDVIDRWLAVGRTVTSDERLTTARTWLVGETTGRCALHLAFGAGGGNPVPVAMAGSSFRGPLRFYPSASPLRAVVGDGPLDPGGSIDRLPGGLTIDAAASAFASILARNPFVTVWPTILADVTPVGRDGELLLRDAAGSAVRVTPAAIGARLVALAGGRPVAAFGLWSGRSIRILSALAEGRLIDLGTDIGGDEDELEIEPVPARGDGEDAAAGSNGVDASAAWGRLVSAALLGTERGVPPAVGLPASVAAVAERPTEIRLLATAAIVAASRRAGWRPEPDAGEPPEPAPPDPRPAVRPAAAWLLRRALDERQELVPEWLELARPRDRRPPDDELPRLLALAARHQETRMGLAPLIGPRARWLVDQIPSLAAGLGQSPEVDPSVAGAAWATQSSAVGRAAIVAELRRRDPAAARALLDEVWDTATTEERALAIGALDRGLGPADEPLLTQAWSDARIEVRAAAIDALARIPGSAFVRLAENVGRPLLTQTGRFRPTIAAEPPAAWSDDLARLGVPRKPPQGTGERAWWLRHIVARVDPANWERWLGGDAKGLIERGGRSDEAEALILGWFEAADRYRDARWSAALLGDRDLLRRADVQELDPFRLLDHLAPDDRDKTAAALIGVADAEIAREVASHCPAPWAPLVAWAVTTAIARSGGSAIWVPQPVRDLARLAARRAPANALEELDRVLGDVGRLSGNAGLTDILDLIRFRQQLAAAFDAEAPR